jgi:lipopolysaccharide/colanic/teichoic acid biosynthesis glycosyltransferase
MNKEEVQVVPDIYIRLVIIYFVSIKIKGNALYQQERQSLKWGKIIVVVLRDCITLNLVFF